MSDITAGELFGPDHPIFKENPMPKLNERERLIKSLGYYEGIISELKRWARTSHTVKTWEEGRLRILERLEALDATDQKNKALPARVLPTKVWPGPLSELSTDGLYKEIAHHFNAAFASSDPDHIHRHLGNAHKVYTELSSRAIQPLIKKHETQFGPFDQQFFADINSQQSKAVLAEFFEGETSKVGASTQKYPLTRALLSDRYGITKAVNGPEFVLTSRENLDALAAELDALEQNYSIAVRPSSVKGEAPVRALSAAWTSWVQLQRFISKVIA